MAGWMEGAGASRGAAWTLAATLAVAACVTAEPAGPGLGGGGGGDPGGQTLTLDSADTRILFVGNSLTYTNDLPAVVGALGRAAGRSVAWASLTMPNWSLEEHWAADADAQIRALAPDYVVLQQGPSTLPESREHLIAWSEIFAPAIREGGGIPALYSVWPSRARFEFFPQVADSYAAAARAVDGAFIPAGETWLRAWDIDPGMELYGPDDFHPSYLGTLAAAQTVVAVLLDVPADSMPALADGATDAERATLREALGRSLRVAFEP